MKHPAMNPHDQVLLIKNGQIPPQGCRRDTEQVQERPHFQAPALLEEGENPFMAFMSEHERS
jgi:hypothetical protein